MNATSMHWFRVGLKTRCDISLRPAGLLALLLAFTLLPVAGSYAASRGGACAGGVVFVDRDASGANDGSSWGDAFIDLQSALTLSEPCEVWVASGVYVPSPDPTDRAATFELRNGLAVYGGFDGSETDRRDRDWRAHPTVLSGDLGGDDVIDIDGAVIDPADINGSNSVHVVTTSGADASAILDGMIITAGDADGPVPAGFPTSCADACGGGLVSVSGSPTLANLRFLGNRASADGAGVFLLSGSEPIMRNVEFSSNSAGRDGGAAAVFDSAPTMLNATFSGNEAGRRGGGLWSNRAFVSPGDGTPTLINASLAGNRAGDSGGAIYSAGDSGPRLRNSIVWNNLDGSGLGTASASIGLAGSSPQIRFSLVQNRNPGGAGNLDGTQAGNSPGFIESPDPAFAPALSGNLRIGLGSVAIDAGDPGVSLVDFPGSLCKPMDLDGNARVVGVQPIDLGAYEFNDQVFAGGFEILCDPGRPCSDGSLCTINETWQADGRCLGEPKCQTGSAGECSQFGCNEATGACITFDKPDGTPCDDGLYCTENDRCEAGACVGPPTCTTDNQCLNIECLENLRTCSTSKKLDGTFCDDGDECTLYESCSDGVCTPAFVDPGCGPNRLTSLNLPDHLQSPISICGTSGIQWLGGGDEPSRNARPAASTNAH
jgi:predicted outer membrane repeat protein